MIMIMMMRTDRGPIREPCHPVEAAAASAVTCARMHSRTKRSNKSVLTEAIRPRKWGPPLALEYGSSLAIIVFASTSLHFDASNLKYL